MVRLRLLFSLLLVIAVGAIGSSALASAPGSLTCSGGAIGSGTYNPFAPHNSSVGGNVIANQPLSLYLSFLTIHGNLVSNGGGGGVTGEFRNFPTKDITVDGNLICQGNTPAAQVNPDDGGQPNIVAGKKIGQCAGL